MSALARLAAVRAARGMTVKPAALFAAIVGSKPVRLARGHEAITYVGGSVPGGTPAVGVWPGNTERSSVVRIPAEHAEPLALALAQRNRQKSALWFTPGSGPDLLHVLTIRGSPGEARKLLNKHGVSEYTLIPGRGQTVAHVVDAGGQQSAPVRAAAQEAGSEYKPTQGTARFVQLQ